MNIPLHPGSVIYISGPMSAFKNQCYNFKHFFYWQVVLERAGYAVLNPAEIDCLKLLKGWVYTDDQWDALLEEDCRLIRENADAVFVLDHHEASKGARREIAEAVKYSKPVFYEEDQRS